jgi:hypothetical protein
MNTRDFMKLEKHILQLFPGFTVKGRLFFIAHVEHTLRGFHFEPSAFAKKNFYVNVFFLPLYVPTEHLHFTFGHRVGLNKRWNADQTGLEDTLASAMLKEVPFLTSLKTAKDVANALKPLTKGSNPHCYEAFAYALAQAGEFRAAVDAIDTLLRLIDSLKRANPEVTWELEIAERAQSFKAKLVANPLDANAQLAAWESETVRNLGLERFLNQAPL